MYDLRKLGTGHEFRSLAQRNHENEDIQRVFRRSIWAFGVVPEGGVGLTFVPLKQREGRLGLLRRQRRGIRLLRRDWTLEFMVSYLRYDDVYSRRTAHYNRNRTEATHSHVQSKPLLPVQMEYECLRGWRENF